VIFNNLNKEHLHKIIDIELLGLFDRMKRLGLHCKISEAAKDFLSEKGYDQKFGARPLKRSIQKYLEDPLAEKIIDSKTREGDTFTIGYDKKKDEIVIKHTHLEQ
jgi:ATP-dependent Clp protease ATP-binding subunit ClpC